MIPADGRILYFRRDREAFRFLSHFFPSPFELDGMAWPTVEHWYQFHKSEHPDYRAAIRAAASPGKTKRLAVSPQRPRRFSHSSWFRKHGELPRSDWDAIKLDVMRRGDSAKYAQLSLIHI